MCFEKYTLNDIYRAHDGAISGCVLNTGTNARFSCHHNRELVKPPDDNMMGQITTMMKHNRVEQVIESIDQRKQTKNQQTREVHGNRSQKGREQSR